MKCKDTMHGSYSMGSPKCWWQICSPTLWHSYILRDATRVSRMSSQWICSNWQQTTALLLSGQIDPLSTWDWYVITSVCTMFLNLKVERKKLMYPSFTSLGTHLEWLSGWSGQIIINKLANNWHLMVCRKSPKTTFFLSTCHTVRNHFPTWLVHLPYMIGWCLWDQC